MPALSSSFAPTPVGTSAEESVRAALDRISRLNGRLGAFVRVDAERALAAARHLDETVRLGVPRGPLFGVPVGIKDVIDVAGMRTQGGSLTRADEPVAARSAGVVEALQAAGAVVIGKTATVEFAFGGWGTNVTLGTPVNPWDLEVHRVPGGSSSGSGVAVAAGLVPLALGTDTGGSIRLPAGFCGIVGLKTTFGLVDRTGVMTLSSVLDSVGPLTRTVAEAALALTVLADIGRLVNPGEVVAVAKGRRPPLAGRRIGVCENLGVTLHPESRRLFDRVLGLLEDAGAVLVPVDFGRSLADFTGPCGHFLSVECYQNFGAFAEEEPCRVGAPVRTRMMTGKALSAPAFVATMKDRDAAKATIRDVYDRVDAILLPTTAAPAAPLGEHDEDASPAMFTRFANYLDLAAVSVPAGLTEQGLPVGVQVVVPGFHEARALGIAGAIEDLTGGPIVCPVAA